MEMDKRKSIKYTLKAGVAGSRVEHEPKVVPTGQEWQNERFDEERGYSFWLNETPIRSFPGCTLPKTLTQADKGTLLDCAMLMEAGTNMLCRRVDGYYKPLTPPKLAEKLGITERQVRRFLKKMFENRIMAQEEGRLYINPCYFFRARYLSYQLYHLFETDLRSVLPAWVVQRYEGE